jgi:hypothetical protein
VNAIAAVICVGLVCWTTIEAVQTITRTLGRRWEADRSFREREVELAEDRFRWEKSRVAAPKKPAPMPDDLVGRIMSWEDDFAQDQERQTIMALYADLEDWDQVRTKLLPLTPQVETPWMGVAS